MTVTKEEFRRWLQTQLSESPCHQDHGGTWRDIEAEDLLPDGVTLGVDHLGRDFVFGLEDGVLASTFEFGPEGETVWPFNDDGVDDNLRDYSPAEAAAAVRAMQDAASKLAGLLPGAATPTPAVWFAAAAYGDRDYGEGQSRLFAGAYDHEPDEREIRRDAFVEAVPDWRDRYPRYEVDAAAYEWQGTLTDALTISIIPATGPEPPPTGLAPSSPPIEN